MKIKLEFPFDLKHPQREPWVNMGRVWQLLRGKHAEGAQLPNRDESQKSKVKYVGAKLRND